MEWNKLKNQFPLSWRNTFITLLVLAIATAISMLLRPVGEDEVYVHFIFILAVMLISLYTEGYFYGISGSLLAVVCVNYIFTYPYLAFNFTITGYPLTFLTMLMVSFIICTLTKRVKKQERIRVEIEKEAIRANLFGQYHMI
jgi:two-component system sensor histidine kinase KdpD